MSVTEIDVAIVGAGTAGLSAQVRATASQKSA